MLEGAETQSRIFESRLNFLLWLRLLDFSNMALSRCQNSLERSTTPGPITVPGELLGNNASRACATCLQNL